MDLGGGTPTLFGITLSLASQDFNVYDGTAATDQIGSITTNEEVTNLLGLTNTEFTVTDATPLGDTPVADLPTEGSVYDVLNLGDGSRTSTPPSRVSTARPTPSPTRW